jgi:hypothetical protein
VRRGPDLAQIFLVRDRFSERKGEKVSYKKLIPAVAGAGVALTLLFTPATPAMAQTTEADQSSVSAVKAATSASAAQGKVKRKSVKCKRPKGNKSRYSWKDGNISTTVYFNNHCSHRVGVTLHFDSMAGDNWSWKACLKTNGGTKGRKKYRHVPADRLIKITKGCRR